MAACRFAAIVACCLAWGVVGSAQEVSVAKAGALVSQPAGDAEEDSGGAWSTPLKTELTADDIPDISWLKLTTRVAVSPDVGYLAWTRSRKLPSPPSVVDLATGDATSLSVGQVHGVFFVPGADSVLAYRPDDSDDPWWFLHAPSALVMGSIGMHSLHCYALPNGLLMMQGYLLSGRRCLRFCRLAAPKPRPATKQAPPVPEFSLDVVASAPFALRWELGGDPLISPDGDFLLAPLDSRTKLPGSEHFPLTWVLIRLTGGQPPAIVGYVPDWISEGSARTQGSRRRWPDWTETPTYVGGGCVAVVSVNGGIAVLDEDDRVVWQCPFEEAEAIGLVSSLSAWGLPQRSRKNPTHYLVPR